MRIGIDLGGTKIEAVAIGDDGSEALRRRIQTPSVDYQATVASIVALINSIESDLGITGSIGIGTPGSLSPSTGLLRNSNSLILNGRPLDRDIEEAIGRDVRLANDANCFALSEAVDGAGSGAGVVLGVILGTGVGAGLVVDQRVLTGRNSIAGEWGHNPIPGESGIGRDCYCGQIDCIEQYLSGPSVVREYHSRSGFEKSSTAVVADRDTDSVADDVMELYVDRLARALAGVINVVDPDVVVLGGGMSNVDFLYDEVPRRWDQWIFSDSVATRLVKNDHGDSSGVRGAAWLWD